MKGLGKIYVMLPIIPHEVLVVDVALAVLMTHQQLLGFLVAQFLPQSCQKVAELSRAGDDHIISLSR